MAPSEHAPSSSRGLSYPPTAADLRHERRKRARRALSNASSSGRPVFPFASRRRAQRSSVASSLSTSSSSSSSSSSSASSSISWPNWRFWQSSSSVSLPESAGSYVPPPPEYTLLLPDIRDTSQAVDPVAAHDSAHPYAFNRSTTSNSDPYTRSHHIAPPSSFAPRVFDLFSSQAIDPVLDRMKDFWGQREQLESLEGDLGAVHGRAGGAAWWLDVLCPTLSDMRAVNKLLPLHPLTIEDILQQETREKTDVYDGLGYYFIAFRALDEKYFHYSDSSRQSDSTVVGNHDANRNPSQSVDSPDASNEKVDTDSFQDTHAGRRRTLNIVEGVGGKEGVEGVGVGAVNLYMVVFPDGIITFHFEDISKHINHVRDRIRHFGVSRSVSSHWIAYDMMDSIVDAFFPLTGFVEAEANEINSILADPFGKAYKYKSSKFVLKDSTDDTWLDEIYPGIRRKARRSVFSLPFLSSMSFWGNKKDIGDHLNIPLDVIESEKAIKSEKTKPSSKKRQIRQFDFADAAPFLHFFKRRKADDLKRRTLSEMLLAPDSPFTQRRQLLAQIAGARKLVNGMSRLLGPKVDLIAGLRKRIGHGKHSLALGPTASQRHDISIYFGDLNDHIVTMQRTLTHLEATLAHDHPTYTGLLRLAMEEAKASHSKSLVRVACITGTMVPMMVVTGIFSANVLVPWDSDNYRWEDNHSLVPWFCIFVVVIIVVISSWSIMYSIFQRSKRKFAKRGSIVSS